MLAIVHFQLMSHDRVRATKGRHVLNLSHDRVSQQNYATACQKPFARLLRVASGLRQKFWVFWSAVFSFNYTHDLSLIEYCTRQLHASHSVACDISIRTLALSAAPSFDLLVNLPRLAVR